MLALRKLSLRSPILWAARGLVFTVFLLTAHCSLLTVEAQTPDPGETIRIDSDLVNLNVGLLNRNAAAGASPRIEKRCLVPSVQR